MTAEDRPAVRILMMPRDLEEAPRHPVDLNGVYQELHTAIGSETIPVMDIAYTPMPTITYYECKACGANMQIWEGEGQLGREVRIAEHDEVCPRRPRGSGRRAASTV